VDKTLSCNNCLQYLIQGKITDPKELQGHHVTKCPRPIILSCAVCEGLGITAYHLRKDCPNAPRQSKRQRTGL